MKAKLILATALATLTLTTGTYAADAVLSPRAQDQQNSMHKAPGTATDMIDRSRKSGSPKGQELAQSQRTVSSTSAGIDLAHGARPTLSPKDPGYEAALRELRQSQIQVAPLK